LNWNEEKRKSHIWIEMSYEGTGGSWLSEFCVELCVDLREKEMCENREGEEDSW